MRCQFSCIQMTMRSVLECERELVRAARTSATREEEGNDPSCCSSPPLTLLAPLVCMAAGVSPGKREKKTGIYSLRLSADREVINTQDVIYLFI